MIGAGVIAVAKELCGESKIVEPFPFAIRATLKVVDAARPVITVPLVYASELATKVVPVES